MTRLLSTLAFSAVLLTAAGSVQAEECLKIASFVTKKRSISHIVSGVQKSFKIAGMCLEHVSLPSKRVQRQMSKGLLDGEFLRGQSYLAKMKEYVIKVPTPVLSSTGFIISLKGSGFAPKGLQDVGNKVIGVVHGVAWNESVAQQLKQPHWRVSFIHLIKLLHAGRIDGFLAGDNMLKRAQSFGHLDMNLLHKSDPIVDLSAYFILHKKNKRYVERLDSAIQQVKKEKGFAILPNQ